MGQQEDPLSLVIGANAGRRKDDPLRVPPVVGQLSEYPYDRGFAFFFLVGDDEASDIFQVEVVGSQVAKDSPRAGPEVSGVVAELPLACEAVALAGDAGDDNPSSHDASKVSAREGVKVTPDRRAIQGLVFHPGHEHGRGIGFPLAVANGSAPDPDVRQRSVNSAVEHPAAGAEGDAVELSGMKYHTRCLY